MNTFFSFYNDFTILYLLISLTLLMIGYRKKYQIQQIWRYNNLVLAILTIPIVLYQIYDFISSFSYISEQVGFYNRSFGFWGIPVMILQFILPFFPLLFLVKKIRKGLWLSLFIILETIISLPVVRNFYLDYIAHNNPDYIPMRWSYHPIQVEQLLYIFIAFTILGWIFYVFIKDKDLKWL